MPEVELTSLSLPPLAMMPSQSVNHAGFLRNSNLELQLVAFEPVLIVPDPIQPLQPAPLSTNNTHLRKLYSPPPNGGYPTYKEAGRSGDRLGASQGMCRFDQRAL